MRGWQSGLMRSAVDREDHVGRQGSNPGPREVVNSKCLITFFIYVSYYEPSHAQGMHCPA